MNITMYTTPVCVYCKQAKEFFSRNGVSYTEVDVSLTQEAKDELIKKSSSLSVPVFDIDGEIIQGFDRYALEQKILSSKSDIPHDPAEDNMCDSCQ